MNVEDFTRVGSPARLRRLPYRIERMGDSVNCEKCQDSGAYVVNTEDEGKGFGGYSTHPCACRAALAPREGAASWWSSEMVLRVDVTIPIFNEMVSVKVSSEVPMSADNFRLLRRGNRYYPTLIEIETPPSLTMHADTARNLARALMQAAEAVDKIDDADTAPCGHWSPCECVAVEDHSVCDAVGKPSDLRR